MTKNVDTEYSLGWMEEGTRANGMEVYNMESESFTSETN